MLELRPIIVNSDMMVLGGNMRLKACIKVGLKEVPIIIADNLTEEQQREFLIKDNVGFGEWNWEQLANDWDIELLSDWGLEIPIEVFEEPEQEIESESITKNITLKYTIDEAGRIENELYMIDSTLEGAVQRLLEINKK
jgi:ParB-like chromosome segregation protein Spo0J